jgi:ABC-2 type transport system ATP-binding protein
MIGSIECNQLTKKYGNFTALNGISFSLEANKIYGLLGRNGAGKTTLLHLLHAHMLPTHGSVTVDGEAPFENSKVLQKICFIKESNNFKKNLTVSEVLNLSSLFYCNWDNDFALRLQEEFNLPSRKKVKALSKGMESALGIIVGLASRAPITIYDEPYIGLDSISRQLFYDLLLQDYAEHPRTIILSTHLIDEVSMLFEKVVVIDQGNLLMIEETDSLRHRAFYVTGDKEAINNFSRNKQILHSETLGKKIVSVVYGGLSLLEKQEAEKAGLILESVPIEKLINFVTLNQKKGA